MRWIVALFGLVLMAPGAVAADGGEPLELRHVSAFTEIVEDLDAAVAFYREILGLDVERTPGDGYARVLVRGVLHFGLWDRRFAAETTLGSAERAAEIPLGFMLGLEVGDVRVAAKALGARGVTLLQQPKREKWGQHTARFLMPGGALSEITETPWARKMESAGEQKAKK